MPSIDLAQLKRVVPAAAAIAVATATASQANLPKKSDGAAIHKDVSELAEQLAKTTPASAPDTQPPSTAT